MPAPASSVIISSFTSGTVMNWSRRVQASMTGSPPCAFAEVEKHAAELLRMMNLTQRSDHKPGQLSGGEQQRVAIARALINSPAVLLADEPSGNLDSHNRDEIHRLFFDLRERLGQTTVIVTHDESLAAMADRRITMCDGLILSPDGV